MIKNLYNVCGLDEYDNIFKGTCVADDIVRAIELFRIRGFIVESVSKLSKVTKDYPNRVVSLKYQK